MVSNNFICIQTKSTGGTTLYNAINLPVRLIALCFFDRYKKHRTKVQN